MLKASPSQNLINYSSECNSNSTENAQGQPKPESHRFSIRIKTGISRKLLGVRPSQNLINFQLECNRNFKTTAQNQPKPESHQFSIEM